MKNKHGDEGNEKDTDPTNGSNGPFTEEPTGKIPEDPENEAPISPENGNGEPETAGAMPGQEIAELKDKYLRLYSDFENFRRRTAKEKIEFMKTANQGLIKDLLPVIDDFERAQKSLEHELATVQTVKEGFQLIHQKFGNILAQHGLAVMPEAKGQPFDIEMHEAITQIPAPSEDLKGKVVDVVEKGYLLGDKVIRFAKVVIGA